MKKKGYSAKFLKLNSCCRVLCDAPWKLYFPKSFADVFKVEVCNTVNNWWRLSVRLNHN